MYSRILVTAAIVGGIFSTVKAAAQQTYTLDNNAVISNVDVQRSKSGINVSMDVDMSNLKVGSGRCTVMTPVIAGVSDTLALPSMSVYGRRNWLYNIRNDRPLTQNEGDKAWKKRKRPSTYSYNTTIPYSPWMDGASLKVNDCVLGCCNKVLADNWTGTDKGYNEPAVPEYKPKFVFVRPKAVVHKMRSLEATSYVDFPVNMTDIYPDYRKNQVELSRIVSTIDSVKNDSDLTIKKITLKGFASPESPYDNNERLAKGRTESVKKYVSSLSHIPESVMATDYEPENWAGLREYVEASNFKTKKEILAIIDNLSLEPDAREWRMKSRYPKEYAYIHEHCYPALRKVDYRIDYEIRQFVGVEDIRASYVKNPQNLSLEEFFVLAESYDESSDEFHEVLNQAVQCYPTDKIANLNAALVAMSDGKMREAGAYLDKAGESYEALYARGVYNALMKDYNRALTYFDQVGNEVTQAVDAAQEIRNILAVSEFVNIK